MAAKQYSTFEDYEYDNDIRVLWVEWNWMIQHVIFVFASKRYTPPRLNVCKKNWNVLNLSLQQLILSEKKIDLRILEYLNRLFDFSVNVIHSLKTDEH